MIASQAVISGAFSLTRQAVQLGYLPWLQIQHTSAKQIGQIYIPGVNWVLMLACLGLVLGFRSSSNLAAAYPDFPAALELLDQPGLNLKAMNSTTLFLGGETLIASSRPGMAIWRERLFALMSRNAQRATAFYRIPPTGWWSWVRKSNCKIDVRTLRPRSRSKSATWRNPFGG